MINLPKYKVVGSKIVMLEDWHIFGLVVLSGFISDGASVPYIFRWFIHKMGILLIAAIFHDFCYKNAINTKAWADRHFYILGLETNKDKKGLAQVIVRIKCRLAYLAVSKFGKGSYK